MRSFILVSFLVMGAVYWEASGGARFRPEAWPEAAATEGAEDAAEDTDAVAGPAGPVEVVTRARTQPGDIADVAPSLALAPRALPLPDATPVSAAEALAAVAPDLATPDLAGPASVAEALASLDAAPDAPGAAPAGAARRRVTGDRVNVREGPGTGYGVVAQLAAGDVAEVIEADGDWVRVRAGGGAEGWMSGRFLEGAGG